MTPNAQFVNALAGRYTIDREIGRGGMATVYLARDVRHNRGYRIRVAGSDRPADSAADRGCEGRVTPRMIRSLLRNEDGCAGQVTFS